MGKRGGRGSNKNDGGSGRDLPTDSIVPYDPNNQTVTVYDPNNAWPAGGGGGGGSGGGVLTTYPQTTGGGSSGGSYPNSNNPGYYQQNNAYQQNNYNQQNTYNQSNPNNQQGGGKLNQYSYRDGSFDNLQLDFDLDDEEDDQPGSYYTPVVYDPSNPSYPSNPTIYDPTDIGEPSVDLTGQISYPNAMNGGASYNGDCPPPTCFDLCKEQEKNQLDQCRMLSKEFQARMKDMGCTTSCKVRAKSTTCRKRKAAKKSCKKKCPCKSKPKPKRRKSSCKKR